MIPPAIIVVAYNRPASLYRLLLSISNANFYDAKDIPLIISIDKGHNNEVIALAKRFQWPYGAKEVFLQSEHLGLKNHILKCGDLSYQFGSIILLEDDLVVSPYFFSYALRSIDFFKKDENIAGISLYSYDYSETARLPFDPIDDGFYNYFMQVPSSWGQAWTAEQWRGFRNYITGNLKDSQSGPLPQAVKDWSHQSWKKQFYMYLNKESKFFVYPRQSYSTNFADKGSNSASSQNLYQVPVILKDTGDYTFSLFHQSGSTYDGFFELIINEKNLPLFPEFIDSEVTIDTYGTKPLTENDAFWLSTKPCRKPLHQWDVSMIPLLNNVIFNIDGTVLSYAEAKDFDQMDTRQRATMEKKLTSLGFMFGADFSRRDLRYRIGNSILFPFRFITRLFHSKGFRKKMTASSNGNQL